MTCHSGWEGESQMIDDDRHHGQCSKKLASYFEVSLNIKKSQWHHYGSDGLHHKPTIWVNYNDYTDVTGHLSKMSYEPVATVRLGKSEHKVQRRCWKILCLEGSCVFDLLVNHLHFVTWRLCLSCQSSIPRPPKPGSLPIRYQMEWTIQKINNHTKATPLLIVFLLKFTAPNFPFNHGPGSVEVSNGKGDLSSFWTSTGQPEGCLNPNISPLRCERCGITIMRHGL